jgi:hypothetical protein
MFGRRASRARIWGIALGVGIGAALIVGIVAASTAGNTVQETRAGVGEGEVTGYNVSSVHYVLNASDPTKVDAVTFSVNEAPGAGTVISAKLATEATTWYACTFSGTDVTCSTTSPQATVAGITSLVVVAAQ